MQTCDSVIQNRCRTQGRCVFGGIHSTACLRKSNHLHSIPISHDTRPQARKSPKQCADFCATSDIEQFFDLGFAATVKT